MAVKYVDNFDFPSSAGFTGSAGKQTVKGYMRGGAVRRPAPGPGKHIGGPNPKAEYPPSQARQEMPPTIGKSVSLHDSLKIQGKKLGFASGGQVNASDTGNMPPNRGRNQAEIEAGGTKELKPGYKRGGKTKMRKAEGGSIPDNWSSMSDAEKRTWAAAQTAPGKGGSPTKTSTTTKSSATARGGSSPGYGIGSGAAARAEGALKAAADREGKTISDAQDAARTAMGLPPGSNKARGGKVKKARGGAVKDFNKPDDAIDAALPGKVAGAEQYGSARAPHANPNKMAKGGNFIAKAIKHPGAFTKKAKAAGMSTGAFAAKVTKPSSKASTTTKRQANLAKTLRSFH